MGFGSCEVTEGEVKEPRVSISVNMVSVDTVGKVNVEIGFGSSLK